MAVAQGSIRIGYVCGNNGQLLLKKSRKLDTQDNGEDCKKVLLHLPEMVQSWIELWSLEVGINLTCPQQVVACSTSMESAATEAYVSKCEVYRLLGSQ